MNIVKTILLVAFVVIAILLVLMILVQNEESNGMGVAFGGGQTTAFGSHSASVLSKTTGVFVALFFVVIFVLAFLNKSPAGDSLQMSATATEVQGSAESSSASSWFEEEEEKVEEAAPAVESEVVESEEAAQ